MLLFLLSHYCNIFLKNFYSFSAWDMLCSGTQKKMYHGGSWPEAPQFTSGKSCPRIWSHPSDVTILAPEKPRRKVRMLLQRRVWMIFSDCLMFYNSSVTVPYNSVLWCDQGPELNHLASLYLRYNTNAHLRYPKWRYQSGAGADDPEWREDLSLSATTWWLLFFCFMTGVSEWKKLVWAVWFLF